MNLFLKSEKLNQILKLKNQCAYVKKLSVIIPQASPPLKTKASLKETAIKLLSRGMSVDDISEITGLSKDEVERMKVGE